MRDKQLVLDEVNFAKAAPSEATVLAIIAKASIAGLGVSALMNTRHKTVKEKGWVEKPPSAAVFAKAVAAEVNLLRRPIYIDGNKIIIGFDKPAYAKLGSDTTT